MNDPAEVTRFTGSPLIVGVFPGQDPAVWQRALDLSESLSAPLLAAFVDPTSYLIEWTPGNDVLPISLEPVIDPEGEAAIAAAELKEVLERADLFVHHAIRRDALSVRQRMSDLLQRLGDGEFWRFESLFSAEEGRQGVVVTFLAVLELAKEQLLEITQIEALAPIYVKSLSSGSEDLALTVSSTDDSLDDSTE